MVVKRMQDWVKLHTDLLDNPDVALISPMDFQVFTFLLLLCRREGADDGQLVGWDFARLAYRFRMSAEDVTRSVTRLSHPDVTWVSVTENGTICVSHFAERQCHKESQERIKARERKRAQRIREKRGSAESGENVTPLSRDSHTPVTRRHAVEEKRIEEKRVDITTGADAPKRKLTELQCSQSVLETQFARLTGLAVPKRQTDAEQKEAATRWWTPLKIILELAGNDLPKAETLMQQALNQLTTQKLTYDSPASLVRTARSLSKKPAPELSSGRVLKSARE